MVYAPSDIDAIIAALCQYTISRDVKRCTYLDIPAALDIETSNFYDAAGAPVAIMYAWTVGIGDAIIFGRTWDDLLMVLDHIVSGLHLNTDKRRLCIYVHNLNFEFQFIRRRLEWTQVFAAQPRRPIYARTVSGVELRCSSILAGAPLDDVGAYLLDDPLPKQTGALDYRLVRHSGTYMTPREIEYCVRDIEIVLRYVQQSITRCGGSAKIPLTKTGYVRQFCRAQCFGACMPPDRAKWAKWRYHNMMVMLSMDVPEYEQLRRAMRGGYTHASIDARDVVSEDVVSYDIVSSYPSVMVAEQYPMGRAELVKIKTVSELEDNCRLYACIFDVAFDGICEKNHYENYIAIARCRGVEGASCNGNMLIRAKRIIMTITDVDYDIIRRYYTWTGMKIGTVRRYCRGYLPTPLVSAILTLYADKTALKGAPSMRAIYEQRKSMLCSCYGMCATNPVRDIIEYVDGQWMDPRPGDVEQSIEDYNTSWSRVLCYSWAPWILAYARRNLFALIHHCGPDYVCSSTDCVKFRREAEHVDYIRHYNDRMRARLYRAMDHHGLSLDAVEPTNQAGDKKLLGAWHFDAHYSKIKIIDGTRWLGMLSDDHRNPIDRRGAYEMVFAGLSREAAMPWLTALGPDVWTKFAAGLTIPAKYSGAYVHTYIDSLQQGRVTDYLGNDGYYREYSALHIAPTDVTIGDDSPAYMAEIRRAIYARAEGAESNENEIL